MRSTYGPFTSRLISRDIDYSIFKEFLRNKNGVTIKYNEELKYNMPEFIRLYFNWLEENKHLTIDDEINVGIFFHAANGGISINEKAETKIKGLFAAGECTGGMHGADRIGGEYAKAKKDICVEEIEFELYEIDKANKLIEEVQDIMFKNAMIEKNQMGVDEALLKINNISKNFIYKEDINMKNIKYSYRLESNILLAKSILKAIDLRKESRGSHYRSDYPTINEKMDRRINVEFDNDIKVYFQGE